MPLAGFLRFLFATALLVVALSADADLTCTARFGWEAHVRPPRWNPVLVTVQDASPRAIDIELSAIRDSSQSIITSIAASATQMPQTYVLYAPLVIEQEPILVRVYDTQTRKKLIEQKLFDPDQSSFGMNGGQTGSGGPFDEYTGGVFVGVSGRERALKELGATSLSSGDRSMVGYIPQYELPGVVKGYDPLDVLVLNDPDLNSMEAPQKKAILDWVHGGGTLLVWFRATPISADDPLARALPCAIGENITIEIGASDRLNHALPDRFAKIGGRVLVPKPGAQSRPVLGGGGAKLVSHAYGFGRIEVLSFDGSMLLFRDNESAVRFWKPILRGGVTETNTSSEPYHYSRYSQGNGTQGEAVKRVTDLLGGVPGIGTFGFSYVAITLIALMLIVGPIDWFLLKWLGRQPWTWITTTGWIGLITLVAVYAGHLLRSGDLHLRTLRVAEQADGAVIAQTDFVGIYSPRTDEYEIEPAPGTWWEPLTVDSYGGGRGAILTELYYRQTLRDSMPDPRNPMTIPVWNLRFIKGESSEKSPAMVAASLSGVGSQEAYGNSSVQIPKRIKGTITNLTDLPLTVPWLRAYGYTVAKDEWYAGTPGLQTGDTWPDTIAAHATVNIDVALAVPVRPSSADYDRPLHGTSYSHAGVEMDLPTILHTADALSRPRRSSIDNLMALPPNAIAYPDTACLCALTSDAHAAATLKTRTPVQKNWLVVRALLPVSPAVN